MPLTPKQLRLVFATLRAKGLLKYVKKNRAMRWSVKATKPLRKSEGRMTRELAGLLEGRLPQFHRELARLKGGITVHPTRSSFIREEGVSSRAAAMYDEKTQRLVLVSSPRFESTTGYTLRPSGATGRFRIAGVSHKRKTFYLSYDTALRQAKVSAALTYYHEYGHAVNFKGKFSKSKAWAQVVAKEWRDIEPGEPTTLMAVSSEGKALDLLTSKGSRVRSYPRAIRAWLGGARETRKTLDPQEAWSEAYAMYAASKTRRHMLRKERPLSYEYMKKFFEK